MKSVEQLQEFFDKSGLEKAYASNAVDAYQDMAYAVSLGETATKQHALLWSTFDIKDVTNFSQDNYEYAIVVEKLYQFLVNQCDGCWAGIPLEQGKLHRMVNEGEYPVIETEQQKQIRELEETIAKAAEQIKSLKGEK